MPPVRKATTASTMAITRMIQIRLAARLKTPPRPKSQAMIRIATNTHNRFPIALLLCQSRSYLSCCLCQLEEVGIDMECPEGDHQQHQDDHRPDNGADQLARGIGIPHRIIT